MHEVRGMSLFPSPPPSFFLLSACPSAFSPSPHPLQLFPLAASPFSQKCLRQNAPEQPVRLVDVWVRGMPAQFTPAPLEHPPASFFPHSPPPMNQLSPSTCPSCHSSLPRSVSIWWGGEVYWLHGAHLGRREGKGGAEGQREQRKDVKDRMRVRAGERQFTSTRSPSQPPPLPPRFPHSRLLSRPSLRPRSCPWRALSPIPSLPPLTTPPPASSPPSCSASCPVFSHPAQRFRQTRTTHAHIFPLPSMRLPLPLRTAAHHCWPHLRPFSHWRANLLPQTLEEAAVEYREDGGQREEIVEGTGEGAREPQRRGMERGKGLDEEGYGNCLPSDEKPPARMACVLCCHAMCPSRAACLHAHVSGGLSLPHSSPPFTSPSFSSHPSSFFPTSSFSSPTASPPLPSSPPLLLSALVISCSFPYPFPSPVSLPYTPRHVSFHPSRASCIPPTIAIAPILPMPQTIAMGFIKPKPPTTPYHRASVFLPLFFFLLLLFLLLLPLPLPFSLPQPLQVPHLLSGSIPISRLLIPPLPITPLPFLHPHLTLVLAHSPFPVGFHVSPSATPPPPPPPPPRPPSCLWRMISPVPSLSRLSHLSACLFSPPLLSCSAPCSSSSRPSPRVCQTQTTRAHIPLFPSPPCTSPPRSASLPPPRGRPSLLPPSALPTHWRSLGGGGRGARSLFAPLPPPPPPPPLRPVLLTATHAASAASAAGSPACARMLAPTAIAAAPRAYAAAALRYRKLFFCHFIAVDSRSIVAIRHSRRSPSLSHRRTSRCVISCLSL
ncbi:unnamed protein product [Closterium sp. NIES-65]|nr:unnamed protein product [Closterium sp. NIES-65]